MKSIKTLYISLLTLAFVVTINAQPFVQRLKNITFIFGLSEHLVIDNGKEYQLKFDTKNWNLMPFPSKISAEAFLKKGWALQTEFAYSSYKSDKLFVIDNVIQTKDNSFFSADFSIRYHLESLVLHHGFFDPYITAGYGFTYRSGVNITQTSTGTNNLGLGCNFWVYKGFGINLQSLGKFALKGGVKSNYAHHSIGIVYKLKPLSGKGVLPKSTK